MDMPFSQLLAYLEKGALDADATEQLQELVKAVQDTRRKGSLTLTVTVSMDGKLDTVARLNADVSTKPPKYDRATTFMFPTYDGDLLRDDPEQRRFDLREAARQGEPSDSQEQDRA